MPFHFARTTTRITILIDRKEGSSHGFIQFIYVLALDAYANQINQIFDDNRNGDGIFS